jgi:hypothetical protein
MRGRIVLTVCALVGGLTLAEPGEATLLVNGGAELGSLAGWTLTPADAPTGSVTSRSQTTGTVLPFEGDRFFTFANAAHPGPIVLSQSGTSGLDAPRLVLEGAFQTEFGDLGEVVLSILDASASVLNSISTRLITSPNLTWRQLPELVLAVPAGAASWNVELRGFLDFGSFVNVHYDAIELSPDCCVPEAGALLLLASALPLLARARWSHPRPARSRRRYPLKRWTTQKPATPRASSPRVAS